MDFFTVTLVFFGILALALCLGCVVRAHFYLLSWTPQARQDMFDLLSTKPNVFGWVKVVTFVALLLPIFWFSNLVSKVT
jgi:dolichyl-phosphate-mannose--protein O-mannosyl transferase